MMYINKGDEIVIEGIKFRVKYDFNSDFDKHLLLKIIRDEPKTYEGKSYDRSRD